jgi:hypothetical protein
MSEDKNTVFIIIVKSVLIVIINISELKTYKDLFERIVEIPEKMMKDLLLRILLVDNLLG